MQQRRQLVSLLLAEYRVSERRACATVFLHPVPFLIIWAPSWSVVTFANVLLGINQGLCWSTTVIMKVDLVGPKRRDFAMALNEFAGYGAVALAALASGYLARKRLE